MLANLLLAAENGRQWPHDINEVYYGSAAFFIVIGLFYWKGWPAIQGAMNGRTERIKAELEDAQRQRAEAESALTSASADLPDPTAEADRIRREAFETAERVKVDIVARAEAEAEAIRTRGAAEIESAKAVATVELQSEVATVARTAATEAVTSSLDQPTHEQLIDDYINQVSRLS